jgi:hypothetical protein
MLIYWGRKYYGRCDQVPGKFFVATMFDHVYLIPLVPTQTCLILDNGVQDDSEWTAYRLPFSFKSCLFGWLRTVLWVSVLLAGFFGIGGLIGKLANPNNANTWEFIVGACVTAIAASTLLYLSYRVTRASPRRALELAALVGIPAEEIVRCFPTHPNIESIVEEFKHGQETALHR